MCNKLEGTTLKIGPNSGTYINIFDIREESLEETENGYLATKITKLIGFFNLIFGNLKFGTSKSNILIFYIPFFI